MFITEEEMNRRLNARDNIARHVKPRSKYSFNTAPDTPPDTTPPDNSPLAPPTAYDGSDDSSDSLTPDVVSSEPDDTTDQSTAPPLNVIELDKSVHFLAHALIKQGENPKEVAQQFNISEKDAKRPPKDSAAKAAMKQTLEAVNEMALNKLLLTLGLLTREDIANAEPLHKAAIASHIARVYEKTADKQQAVIQNQSNIIVYSPQQRTEEHYKVVDL